jgi:hypothetical protein
MKRWLLILMGALAAFMLVTAAAPERSEAHGHSHVSIGAGVYIGPGWYGPYYDPWYDPWYGPGYYYPPRYYYPEDGFLQTTIEPDTAEVWVDGKYFGVARDFDGATGSLKLWPGEHQAEFRMPGYKTYTVDFAIRPGSTTAVDYDLVPLGEGPPVGKEGE